jgi:hypothetical protein
VQHLSACPLHGLRRGCRKEPYTERIALQKLERAEAGIRRFRDRHGERGWCGDGAGGRLRLGRKNGAGSSLHSKAAGRLLWSAGATATLERSGERIHDRFDIGRVEEGR